MSGAYRGTLDQSSVHGYLFAADPYKVNIILEGFLDIYEKRNV